MGTLKAALSALFNQNTTNAASQQNALVPIVKYQNSQYQIIGVDSMANLASVLGGITTNLSNSDSLDDITTPGKYVYKSTNPSMTGVPSGITTPFFMYVDSYTSGNNVVTLQKIVTLSYNDIYIRNYSASQSKWLDWKKFEGVSIT